MRRAQRRESRTTLSTASSPKATRTNLSRTQWKPKGTNAHLSRRVVRHRASFLDWVFPTSACCCLVGESHAGLLQTPTVTRYPSILGTMNLSSARALGKRGALFDYECTTRSSLWTTTTSTLERPNNSSSS